MSGARSSAVMTSFSAISRPNSEKEVRVKIVEVITTRLMPVSLEADLSNSIVPPTAGLKK